MSTLKEQPRPSGAMLLSGQTHYAPSSAVQTLELLAVAQCAGVRKVFLEVSAPYWEQIHGFVEKRGLNTIAPSTPPAAIWQHLHKTYGQTTLHAHFADFVTCLALIRSGMQRVFVDPDGIDSGRSDRDRERIMNRNIRENLSPGEIGVFVGGTVHIQPLMTMLERNDIVTSGLVVIDTRKFDVSPEVDPAYVRAGQLQISRDLEQQAVPRGGSARVLVVDDEHTDLGAFEVGPQPGRR